MCASVYAYVCRNVKALFACCELGISAELKHHWHLLFGFSFLPLPTAPKCMQRLKCSHFQ